VLASSVVAGIAHPVMPAKAGIHDLSLLQQRKSWMPAFAGMADGAGHDTWINLTRHG
jgi:hypothetical protein